MPRKPRDDNVSTVGARESEVIATANARDEDKVKTTKPVVSLSFALCGCGCRSQYVVSPKHPFGAYASAGCQRQGEKAAEAAAMAELATGRKLRARLGLANAWAKRLGRTEKALSIPLAPSAMQAKELHGVLGRFEEFLRTSEEGDRRRARLSRGR